MIGCLGMPIHEYPFIYPSKRSTWQPHLPIKVVNKENGREIPDIARVDTGSKSCYIPFEYARELKVILADENKTKVFSGDVEREGYWYDLEIKILRVKKTSSDRIFVDENESAVLLPEIRVIFVRDLKRPLLGFRGFLGKHVLVVNYHQKKFSIRTPDKDMPCRICRPV